MTPSGIAVLKFQEGKRNKVYMDTQGIPTIGYGRNLRDRGITDDEAEMLLVNDVEDLNGKLQALPWYAALDATRKDVVMNMAFNLGFGGLLGFKRMIAWLDAARTDAVNANAHYEAAANELNQSYAARQLPKRYAALAYALHYGAWEKAVLTDAGVA